MSFSIVVDLDGTLANCDWRLHHVKNKPKNWKAFFDGIPNDPPIIGMIELVRSWQLSPSNKQVIYCTARPEKYRRETLIWLDKHFISSQYLYMRPATDFSPSAECKKHLLNQIRADGFNPTMVIDDDQSVCDMFAQEGLVVLQVKRKS